MISEAPKGFVYSSEPSLCERCQQMVLQRARLCLSERTKQSTTPLTLQCEGGGVVVEGHFCSQVTLRQTVQLVPDERGLPRSGVAHQHQRLSLFQQQVHEVAQTHGLCCVHQNSLQS